MARQPWCGVLCAFALLASLSACSNAPSDQDAVGGLRLFLDAMDRRRSDPSAREEAFALLAQESREDLHRRARLATALAGGRDLAPYELLVPGRFRLRFTPRSGDGFSAQVEGERATVLVRGRGQGERADVEMRREHGHWRVFLDFEASDEPARDGAPSAPPAVEAPSPDHAPASNLAPGMAQAPAAEPASGMAQAPTTP